MTDVADSANRNSGDNLLSMQPAALAVMVTSALANMIHTLNVSRDLLDGVQRVEANAESDTLRRFGESLSAAERSSVRKVVEDTRNEFRQRIEQFAEEEDEKWREGSRNPDPNSIYPASTELQMAGLALGADEIIREIVSKNFKAFEDDLPRLRYALTLFRSGDKASRELILGQALLPKIVSSLEEFLAALMRAGLFCYPKGLGELPDVPFDIIRKYGRNIETADLDRWAIDKKVSSIISSAPDEWQKRILAWTKIDIAQLGADWGALVEAIQRRHAVTHNAGRADGEYLKRVDERFLGNVIAGKVLGCDKEYMQSVIREVRFFVQILAVKWAAFLKVDPFLAFPDAIEAVVEYESQRLWTRGELLCRAILKSPQLKDGGQRDGTLVNWWFCRQEIGGEGLALENEIRAFSPSDDFDKLGKAALLRDRESTMELVRKMLNVRNPVLMRRTLREMPLVSTVMGEIPELRSILDPGAKQKPQLPSAKRRKRR